MLPWRRQCRLALCPYQRHGQQKIKWVHVGTHGTRSLMLEGLTLREHICYIGGLGSVRRDMHWPLRVRMHDPKRGTSLTSCILIQLVTAKDEDREPALMSALCQGHLDVVRDLTCAAPVVSSATGFRHSMNANVLKKGSQVAVLMSPRSSCVDVCTGQSTKRVSLPEQPGLARANGASTSCMAGFTMNATAVHWRHARKHGAQLPG